MFARASTCLAPGRILACAVILGLLAGAAAPTSAQRGGFGHMGGGRIGGFNGHAQGFHGGFSHFGGFGHGGFHHFGFGHGGFHHHSNFFFGIDLAFGYPLYAPVYYPYYAYYPYYVEPPVYAVPEPVYVPAPPPVRRDYRSGDDDYYLYRRPTPSLPKDPGLAQAVSDIQTAFRTGDIALLEKHVLAEEKLTVRSPGHAEQSLDGGAYLDRTRDAFKDMKTVRYDLDRFEPAGDGAWKVEGTHVLRRDDGTEKRYHVHFLLKRQGDMWVIVEVGADPA